MYPSPSRCSFNAFSMAVVSIESKAFSKSMNAMYSGVLYSLHFSKKDC